MSGAFCVGKKGSAPTLGWVVGASNCSVELMASLFSMTSITSICVFSDPVRDPWGSVIFRGACRFTVGIVIYFINDQLTADRCGRFRCSSRACTCLRLR